MRCMAQGSIILTDWMSQNSLEPTDGWIFFVGLGSLWTVLEQVFSSITQI